MVYASSHKLSLSFSLRHPSDICAAVGDCEVLVREWRVSSLEPRGMSVFASGRLMEASACEAVSVFLRLESWQTTVLCHCSVCFITNQIHKFWTQATFNPDVKSSDAMQIFSFYMIDEYWALLCTCNILSCLWVLPVAAICTVRCKIVYCKSLI